MRIVVLGGTRFVGRAIVAALEGSGHEVLVVRRGVHEPETGSRSVDVSGMNGSDAEAALAALPSGIRLVAISGCDVYRALPVRPRRDRD
jgi:nucleoside-diphosphate-sugar epimerase